MYSNIDKKLKVMALVWFIVNASLSVLSGFILMLVEHGDLFLTGLLILLFGSFSALLSSWLIYGFAVLIANSNETLRLARAKEFGTSAYSPEEKDRLEKIERLYEQGLITEEEYNRARLNFR